LWRKIFGSVPFAHVAIDHSRSQQPVPRGFPLFKRCEWLVQTGATQVFISSKEQLKEKAQFEQRSIKA